MGLTFCCFASGSKGNCSYVSDGKTSILIDLGISAQRTEKCLEAIGVDPDSVGIVITHSHSDHIGGIKVFAKRHPGARLHCQSESARAIAELTGVRPETVAREFGFGGLSVSAIPVPHDVPCFGYTVSCGGKSVAVVTDIGEVSPDLLNRLSGCDIVMLEANHDPDRLRMNPRYTPVLKARISSRYGHLSNAACAEACSYLAGRGVKNFVLAHLSEENNAPTLALSAVNGEIERSGVTGVRVVCAAQDRPTGMFEIC